MSIFLDTRLSQGFSAGNYANSYESENLATAMARRDFDGSGTAYKNSFIMGFFASYEFHEIPDEHQGKFVNAYHSEDGQRVLELGYCDKREELSNGS